MATVDSIARVRVGLHSNVADHTSTPGTLTVIECFQADGFGPRQTVPLERDLYAADGARFPAAVGVQDLSPLTIGMHMRGSTSDGGATTWQNVMEQARMLDSFFGTAAAASSGAMPTMTNLSSTTLTASSNVLANGDIILLETDEGAEVRMVESGGGTTTLTIDRALVGTFTDNSSIYRLGKWTYDTSITQHIPAYFDREWVDAADIRRPYFGCVPESLDLAFPIGGIVTMSSVWHPTSWADAAAADPTYAAPTAGSPIVVADSPFMIGSNEFLLEEASLSFKNNLRFRVPTTAPNGRLGAVITKKHDAMLKGRLYVSNNASSLGELQDDSGTPSLGTLLHDGATAGTVRTMQDISFQVGLEAGHVMYVRIPRADIRGTVAPVDGVLMLEFEAIATRPASGAASVILGVL